MIVVDTSAIVAVLFGEDGSSELERRLVGEQCVMSAATRVELGIVIEAKTGAAGTQLLEELLGRIGLRWCRSMPSSLRKQSWHGVDSVRGVMRPV